MSKLGKKFDVQFEEKSHVYTVSGKRVPSVTQVLPDIPEWLLHRQEFIEKTIIGTNVHKWCELINKGEEILLRRIPDKERPYVQAWVNYLETGGIQILDSEFRIYNATHNYAGTVDVRAKDEISELLIDIKTVSQVSPATALQLAGYIHGYNDGKDPTLQIFRRRCVQLKPDETFRVYDYPVSDLNYDQNIFLCKLVSHQWDRDNLPQKGQ